MKMRTKIVALMLVVMLVFTGCASSNIGIKINSDGSGSIETLTQVDRAELINESKKAYDEMGLPLTKAEIGKELDTSMKAEGFKIVTIDGKKYYQVKETGKIKKGNLQKSFGDPTAASYVTTDTVYLELDLSTDAMNMGDMGEMFSKADMAGMGIDMSTDAIKTTVSVEMPKSIVSTNGTIDAENPNKVTFTAEYGKKNTLFATTKSGVTQKSVKATIKKLNALGNTKIKKLKANKTTVTLKFKKVKKADKYDIEYSTKKNFKNAKAKTTKKTSFKIKNLKKGKKYYVRVRAVKVNYAGVEVHSKWVKKSVKINK